MILPDIRHLQGEEIPFGVQGARDFLEQLLSIMDMLQLYEECFPEAFLRDHEQDLSIFPALGHDYSPREVNFFRLVDKHYFPFPVDFLPDDPDGERCSAASIPIASMGFDFYEEDQYEELSFSWKLLLYLLGVVNDEWLQSYGEDVSDDLLSIPVARASVSEALLIQRCEAQGGALAFFALALQMLRNDTASVWLNVTMDDPCLDMSWTKEDMEELRRQYQSALMILEKATCFCKWLEEDPGKHFALVARLWNSCARDTPTWKTRLHVMQIAARDFVDGGREGSSSVDSISPCQSG